ncbi:hypothetical protein COOONC_18753 [Cooperia oncophora]
MSAETTAQPATYPVDPRPTNTTTITTHSPSDTTVTTNKRSQSQGRTPWGTGRRYSEIDDHIWKYTLNDDTSEGTVVGFGNVRIPSEENIAKLSDRKLTIRSITWNINEKKTLSYPGNPFYKRENPSEPIIRGWIRALAH